MAIVWTHDTYSSHVQSVGWDDEGFMVVTFSNGKRYAYDGVSEQMANDVAMAPSVGSILNDQIKGKYNHRRL